MKIVFSRENEETDREGHSWSRLWDMSIPLKLFIDGSWTEICFPIRPHDGKIMADSVVVEIRFVYRIKSHITHVGIG